MPYGPSSSPIGPNRALDALAAQMRRGEVALNGETANRVMDLVESDGKITVEESATLEGVWDTALHAKDNGLDHTAWGRELLMEYSGEARNRLFAHQANTASNPMSMWMSMMTWGFVSTKPSYIEVDQSPRGGRTDKASTEAIEDTAEDMAGWWDLLRLVEAEHPNAISDPGHTHRRPTLNADVEDRYQQLRADIAAGSVDENDPLAPMREYLDVHY